jgi:hypothetical protein
MRILLDECLPARLRHVNGEHEVRTVRQEGWPGEKNGKLLKLIAESGEFDVFVTMDKNLPRQQQLSELKVNSDQTPLPAFSVLMASALPTANSGGFPRGTFSR